MATWLRIADARVQDDGAIPAEEEGIARGTGKKKERARALKAAADAAPTRATRFLKPVLGVEVRSVA